MKIYTKKGDKGETSLFGGQTVAKDHYRIEAYGTVDELNSFLGLALSYSPVTELVPILTTIQHDLFIIGADLATPESKKTHVLRISEDKIDQLEQWIDHFDAQLPALTSFILPSGTVSASYLHVARTVCRRAERLIVTAIQHDEINSLTLKYINRLSDLLFVLSRFENFTRNIHETKWIRA